MTQTLGKKKMLATHKTHKILEPRICQELLKIIKKKWERTYLGRQVKQAQPH